MPTPDTGSSKPDVRTPSTDGLQGQKVDELNNDARMAPKAPTMSGGAEAEDNPLSAPPDIRETGKPETASGTEEPRTGR